MKNRVRGGSSRIQTYTDRAKIYRAIITLYSYILEPIRAISAHSYLRDMDSSTTAI